MIKLKRVLAPMDDTPFDEICSFETDNYIGVFIDYFPGMNSSGFIIMPKDDISFDIYYTEAPNSLEQLDATVFYKVDEHINSVSTSRHLKISIEE